MADIPICKVSSELGLHSRVLTAASFGVGIILVGVYCWRVITKGAS